MKPQIMTMTDAVAAKVHDGSSVYLGNFGAQLFAVGHEIIRQRVQGLDAIIASGGLLLDQLLGARSVSSATFGHCWSPVGPAPAWNFRRLAESGDTSVAITEMSLGMMTAGLTAGAWGVPFMPFPGLEQTGFVTEGWARDSIAVARTPFGDNHVVRALTPDVAFIHVDRCDADGNGWINGPLGEVLLAASAAKEVVMVTEALVQTAELLTRGITVPGVLISAIVVAPGAVGPDGAAGRYDRDVEAYTAYTSAAATPEGFERWREALGSATTGDAS